MSRRRRPAAPGVRPPQVNERRACVVCGKGFVLDRQAQPWSRARTCSGPCRARLGNRGRDVTTCRHCDMVEGYRLARYAEEQAAETIGDGLDEDWRSRSITFRRWLEGRPLERWDDGR